jgi:hypothetical protein
VIYTEFGDMEFKSDREFRFSEQKMLHYRKIDIERRAQKACVFLSSAKDNRFTICNELKEMGLVDIYGLSVGNKVESKKHVSSEYMFQICFENSSNDTYITEKLFEAWDSGNIPIYHKKKFLPFLNRSAILETSKLDSVEIAQLILKTKNINQIASRPILREPFFRETFNQKLLRVISERCEK